MDDMLDPRDIPALRILAGANFGPNAQLTLPSGRTVGHAEAQALTSAYAPAFGQAEDLPEDTLTEVRRREDASFEAWPSGSLVEHYLRNGGTPNERSLAILAEADRGRERRGVTPSPAAEPVAAESPKEPGLFARLFGRR